MNEHLRERIERVFDMSMGCNGTAEGLQSWRKEIERIIDPEESVRSDITKLFNDFGVR